MLKPEVQRKMEYMSKGADMYESGWRSNIRDEYIRQSCEYMNLTPQAMKLKNPEYYKEILARACEEADLKWEEEKALIAKWEEQRKNILGSVRMAETVI